MCEEVLYDYDETICPICGGKIKHPYTGSVTSEQIEEDLNSCIWMEVSDESRSCLGYTPICRNIRISKDEDGGVTYNFIDIINSDKTHDIDFKVDLVKKVVKHYTGKDTEVVIKDDKITGFVDSIGAINICLSMNEAGNIVIN